MTALSTRAYAGAAAGAIEHHDDLGNAGAAHVLNVRERCAELPAPAALRRS